MHNTGEGGISPHHQHGGDLIWQVGTGYFGCRNPDGSFNRGKLGFPAEAMMAFGLGCDMVHVAREAMMAIGCIQALRCHTGHCPAGVATQNRWLMRGLDPTLKSARLANYVVKMRSDLLKLSHACGLAHPALVTGEHLEILDDRFATRPLHEVFNY